MKNAVFALLAIVFMIAPGCDDNKSKKGSTELTANVQQAREDNGDFKLSFAETEPGFYTEMMYDVKNAGLIQEAIAALNGLFALPYDIPVTFTNKKNANAEYQPATRSIEFDLDFVSMIQETLEDHYRFPVEEEWKKTMNVVIFFLFHEVGHSLVDAFRINKTSPEEDMVDYFAVFLLASGDEEPEKAAMDAAVFFLGLVNQFGIPADMRAYADEHSIDIKRFYNILNMLYGKNPGKYAHLVEKKVLPPETYKKTARLQKDYQDIMNGWSKTLEIHLRETPVVDQ